MPEPISSAVAIGAQAGGQILNIGSQQLTGYLNRRHARRMYDLQRGHNIEDRDYANEYNLPANQMKRLKDAGLNPNLIYGNGAAVQTSEATKNATPEVVNMEAPQIDAQGILTSYADMRIKNAQADNLEAQAEVTRETLLLRKAEIESKLTGTELTKFKLSLGQKLEGYQLEAAKLGNEYTGARLQNQLTTNQIQTILKQNTIDQQVQTLANLKIDEVLKSRSAAKSWEEKKLIEQQVRYLRQMTSNARKDGTLKQLEIQLNQMGYTKNDPAYIRAIIQFFNNHQEKTQQFFNDLKNK